MMQRGFDRIAAVYDELARLVFGDAIQLAQEYFVNDIPSQSKVLIIGGGTGKFLDKLLVSKSTCKVWYIEASLKMLELSKEKTNHSNRVHFIHGTEDSIPSDIKFDLVILNFYIDLFVDASLDPVLKKIQKVLKPNSLWYITDFVDGRKWWQLILLRIMYLFFRITCGVKSSKLPDWSNQLQRMGLVKVKSKFFYREFIEATVYHPQ